MGVVVDRRDGTRLADVLELAADRLSDGQEAERLPVRVPTSGLERLASTLDDGPGTIGERTRAFCAAFPSELAKVRRQVYREMGMYPVPIGGSSKRGLPAAYFATRLRDGAHGYLQRRTDDCWQAAIASCLQVPAHLVPDLQIEQQLASGIDPEEMERGIKA